MRGMHSPQSNSIRKGNSVSAIRSKSTVFVAQVEKYGTASDAIFEMYGELTDLRARCEKAEKRLEYVTTNIGTVAAGQCYETQDEFYAAIDAAIAKERTS